MTTGFVAETTEAAKDIFFEPQNAVMNRIGAERGWPPSGRQQFEAACGPNGHLLIGDPDRVADRIIELHRVFGNSRILIQMAIGAIPDDRDFVAKEIEDRGFPRGELVLASLRGRQLPVIAYAFVIELAFLKGRAVLSGTRVESVLSY